MISVADLLVQPRLPGHYYSSQAYVQGDLEMDCWKIVEAIGYWRFRLR